MTEQLTPWTLQAARVAIEFLQGETRASINIKPRIPEDMLTIRAYTLKEVLLRRLKDSLAACVLLIENDLLIPAVLVTRSQFELAALLFELQRKCHIYLEKKNFDEMTDWFLKVMMGNKLNEGGVPAVNILSAIDAMDKEFENIRNLYNRLSEFAHPNMAGLLAAYSKRKDNENTLLFGPGSSPKLAMVISSMQVSCHVSVTCAGEAERRIADIEKMHAERKQD